MVGRMSLDTDTLLSGTPSEERFELKVHRLVMNTQTFRVAQFARSQFDWTSMSEQLQRSFTGHVYASPELRRSPCMVFGGDKCSGSFS